MTSGPSLSYDSGMAETEQKRAKRLAAQRRYRRKFDGYHDSTACIVRDCGTFHAVVLAASPLNSDLIVTRWLCRDVDEQTAREAVEEWKATHGNHH